MLIGIAGTLALFAGRDKKEKKQRYSNIPSLLPLHKIMSTYTRASTIAEFLLSLSIL